jgi:hypothetical protein
MRLRALLFVSDNARRAVARLQPNSQRTARGAMATREAVVAYVQERLDALSELAPWWDNEPLSTVEAQDARAAVEYLRHAGKSDGEIRAWLLLQRARYDLRSDRDGTAN